MPGQQWDFWEIPANKIRRKKKKSQGEQITGIQSPDLSTTKSAAVRGTSSTERIGE